MPEKTMLSRERTLGIIKPDAVRRGIVGEILGRVERVGLKITALKMIQPDDALAQAHYTWEDIGARHGEAVWKRLHAFLCSGPVVAFVAEGPSAVAVLRKLSGATEPLQAAPGTIRGDYCHQNFALSTEAQQSIRNVIHASADPEDGERECRLWFKEEETVSYKRNDEEEHRLGL